jgi:hypothetical protein
MELVITPLHRTQRPKPTVHTAASPHRTTAPHRTAHPMRIHNTVPILCAIALAVALPLSPQPARAEHPHAPTEGLLSLDVCTHNNRIHLLTGESPGPGAPAQLLHRVSTDNGVTWTNPVRVDTHCPPPFGLRRGMDARITAHGDHLLAAWTTAGTDAWGSGPLTTALSEDGGRTWTVGPNPADDRSTTGHGFHALAAEPSGTLHLIWLDSRDGRQGLRHARSSDHGRHWSTNKTLKAATCECCSNALAISPDGTAAALFRDGDPRDLSLAHSTKTDAPWTLRGPAAPFDWRFNGCPHVGGALAFSTKNTLHAALWTGAEGKTGVYHRSTDSLGSEWSALTKLGSDTASHPDLATSSDGTGVALVWDQPTETRSAIWAATSRDNGLSWSAPIRLSADTADATNPRIVPVTSGYRVFWTQQQPHRPPTLGSAHLPKEPQP